MNILDDQLFKNIWLVKTIIIPFVFLVANCQISYTQIQFFQCEDCTNSDNNQASHTYDYSTTLENFLFIDITSDFGARFLNNNPYDWHGGVDYRDYDSNHLGKGDAVAALASGEVYRIIGQGGAGLKDIIVEGENFNYAYRHIL
jgi:hypothetical protein